MLGNCHPTQVARKPRSIRAHISKLARKIKRAEALFDLCLALQYSIKKGRLIFFSQMCLMLQARTRTWLPRHLPGPQKQSCCSL